MTTETAEIKLKGIYGTGKVALVDKVDEVWANTLNCFIYVNERNGYHSVRYGNTGRLHREVARRHGLSIEGKEVDHINGDTLDNRMANLRACTHEQNNQNRATSAVVKQRKLEFAKLRAFRLLKMDKGVRRAQTQGRWIAQIGRIHLGTFLTKEDALASRKEAERIRKEDRFDAKLERLEWARMDRGEDPSERENEMKSE